MKDMVVGCKKMFLLSCLALILLVAFATVGLPSELKIAAVYLVPAADGGFCETLHRSLIKAADEEGYVYNYSENVNPADAERVIRGYAERGYDIIFAHTTGYKTAVERAAPDYPDTLFMLFAGNIPLSNTVMYDWHGNESCYLLGVIAGMMTATNSIGHVGGMKIPNQLRYMAGFEAGIQSVNPDAELSSAFTGSFTDAAGGKEVATTLLNQGADMLFDTMGLAWIGVKDLAKEQGAYILADYGYKTVNAPDVLLAGQLVHYDILLNMILEDWDTGTLQEEYWGSLANGICDIMYSTEAEHIIPYVTRKKVEEARQKIISGEIKVPE